MMREVDDTALLVMTFEGRSQQEECTICLGAMVWLSCTAQDFKLFRSTFNPCCG
jgi:hypothetical protein